MVFGLHGLRFKGCRGLGFSRFKGFKEEEEEEEEDEEEEGARRRRPRGAGVQPRGRNPHQDVGKNENARALSVQTCCKASAVSYSALLQTQRSWPTSCLPMMRIPPSRRCVAKWCGSRSTSVYLKTGTSCLNATDDGRKFSAELKSFHAGNKRTLHQHRPEMPKGVGRSKCHDCATHEARFRADSMVTADTKEARDLNTLQRYHSQGIRYLGSCKIFRSPRIEKT